MSEKIKKVMQGIEQDIKRHEEINGGLDEDMDYAEIEEMLDEEDLEDEIE